MYICGWIHEGEKERGLEYGPWVECGIACYIVAFNRIGYIYISGLHGLAVSRFAKIGTTVQNT